MTEFYASSIMSLCGGNIDKIEKFKNDLLSKIQNKQAKIFIGSETWEQWTFLHPELLSFVETLISDNVKVILIWDNASKDNPKFDLLKSLGVELIFLDYFLYRVYKEIIVKQVCQKNESWDATGNKFLFLTGKPYKINRLDLLLKFHNVGLLDKCRWSLLLAPDYLPEPPGWYKLPLPWKEFTGFVEKYTSNPDNILPIIKMPNGQLHYGGIPFDHTIYQQCLFRVISESHFKNGSQKPAPWITEKTWLTIANRCPFIMAGDTGTLDQLEKMGFRTFREYLKIPDYDNIQDPYQRLDAIVTNTRHWVEGMKFSESIAKDVEYNYNLFVQHGEKIEQYLKSMISKLAISAEPETILTTIDDHAGRNYTTDFERKLT